MCLSTDQLSHVPSEELNSRTGYPWELTRNVYSMTLASDQLPPNIADSRVGTGLQQVINHPTCQQVLIGESFLSVLDCHPCPVQMSL